MLFLARFSYITFLFNFSFGTRDWNLDLPLRGKRSTTEPVLLLNDTVLLIATDSSFLIGKFRIKCLVSFFPLFFLLNNPSAFQKWSMVLIPSIYSFPWTVLTTSSFVWQWYHRIIICISSSSLLLLWLEIFLDIQKICLFSLGPLFSWTIMQWLFGQISLKGSCYPSTPNGLRTRSTGITWGLTRCTRSQTSGIRGTVQHSPHRGVSLQWRSSSLYTRSLPNPLT